MFKVDEARKLVAKALYEYAYRIDADEPDPLPLLALYRECADLRMHLSAEHGINIIESNELMGMSADYRNLMTGLFVCVDSNIKLAKELLEKFN